MLRLLLIRHGATACSEAERYCGHHDPPLTALGRAQAAALRAPLAAAGPVAAVSSDLRRAVETAALAWPAHPPLVDAAWREIDLGPWDGHTHAEIVAGWPAAYAAWRADRFHTSVPGGESGEALLARVDAAVARLRLLTAEGPVAVFAHAGPIAALRCRAAGRPPREFDQWLPELGSLHPVEDRG